MNNNFYVAEKTSAGVNALPIDSLLFDHRVIYIEGPITSELAMNIIRQIHLLSIKDSEKAINILINSHGGEINSGMLIYDAIQGSPCPVNTYCVGCAYSMGAILTVCGTGERGLLPHSKLMLHEPLISGGLGGSASSIEEVSKSLNNTKKQINKILAKHTGHTVREIDKATAYDHYYEADEAVKFGLCDRIVKFSDLLFKED